MKEIRKLLLGISIILFGIAIVSSQMGNITIYTGLGISMMGLLISIFSYYVHNNNDVK